MATMTEADTLMRRFIESDDAAGERLLEELLSTHAGPRIRRMLNHRLAWSALVDRQDLDDLCAEVLAELLYRLRQMKEHASGGGIEHFESYAASATYRAYSDYLRRKYPASS